MEIKKLLSKPAVYGVIADVNQGKSMLLYHLIEETLKIGTMSLYYYGLRIDVEPNRLLKSQRIYTTAELENIRDSLIIVDELSSLFDLDNRKTRKNIENTLRLINHNNNILILCGTPENFKKFLSAKLNKVFFKKTSIQDAINGSTIKNMLMNYKGYERGSELLNLRIDQALFFDGKHYSMLEIPYYKQYDSKKDNVSIIQPSNIQGRKKPTK